MESLSPPPDERNSYLALSIIDGLVQDGLTSFPEALGHTLTVSTIGALTERADGEAESLVTDDGEYKMHLLRESVRADSDTAKLLVTTNKDGKVVLVEKK